MPSLTCWKCSSPLTDLILPMSIREECTHCHADQHVCMMCEHYSSRMGCDEERAESVSDISRANFCDYFKPTLAVKPANNPSSTAQAKAKLAELFGDPPPEPPSQQPALSPQELAEKKLRELLAKL